MILIVQALGFALFLKQSNGAIRQGLLHGANTQL